jgi:hypothetical protein
VYIQNRENAAMEVDTASPEACLFLHGSTDQLDVKLPDGSAAHLIAVAADELIARDRQGQLIVVHRSRRVRSRRNVLVQQTCNNMPRVWVFQPVPVIFALATPPRIELLIDEDQIVMSCTGYAY